MKRSEIKTGFQQKEERERQSEKERLFSKASQCKGFSGSEWALAYR